MQHPVLVEETESPGALPHGINVHHRSRLDAKAPRSRVTLAPLVTGEDNLVLHAILQHLSNRELHDGPLRASGRMHKVAVRCLDPTVRCHAAVRWVADSGRVAAVRALLEDGRADPSVYMNEALRRAARNGHRETVRLLLRDRRVDPSARDSEALRRASERGHIDVVRLLLQDGRADPMARSGTGVGMALINGHAAVGRLLLQDERVTVTPYMKRNIFRRTCACGHTESVAVLLADDRFDPHVGNGMPLREACENGHADIVQLLLQDGRTDPNARAGGALRYACEFGQVDVVRLLLRDRRVDPAVAHSRAVLSACSGASVECLELLIKDGRADPGANCQAALLEACARSHMLRAADMLALLLGDERVDPSVMRGDALRLALEGREHIGGADYPEPVRGDVNVSLGRACHHDGRRSVELLLRDGRVLTGGASGRLAMRAALYCRHDPTVRLLLDRNRAAAVAPGYDPMHHGGEALVLAAALGHQRAVELLVPRCIGSERSDWVTDALALKIGSAALMAACQSGFMDAVRCLLQDGRLAAAAASPMAYTALGAMAHAAGAAGHARLVEAILDDGLLPTVGVRGSGGLGDRMLAAARLVSPGARGASGEAQYAVARRIVSLSWETTPLGFAARRGLVGMVRRCLAEMCAKVRLSDDESPHHVADYMRNWRDEFALEDACRAGHVEVVRLLLGSKSPHHSPAINEGRPLAAACANGHAQIVELLLEDGRAQAALQNGTALARARSHGHDAIARMLMTYHAAYAQLSTHGQNGQREGVSLEHLSRGTKRPGAVVPRTGSKRQCRRGVPRASHNILGGCHLSR